MASHRLGRDGKVAEKVARFEGTERHRAFFRTRFGKRPVKTRPSTARTQSIPGRLDAIAHGTRTNERFNSLGRYLARTPGRASTVSHERLRRCSPITLRASRRTHVSYVRTRRVGGNARGYRRRVRNPSRGGMRSNHCLSRYLWLHDGRPRNRRQVHDSRVRSTSAHDQPPVFPLRLLRPGRLHGTRTQSLRQRPLRFTRVPRRLIPRRHGRRRTLRTRLGAFRHRRVGKRGHPPRHGR